MKYLSTHNINMLKDDLVFLKDESIKAEKDWRYWKDRLVAKYGCVDVSDVKEETTKQYLTVLDRMFEVNRDKKVLSEFLDFTERRTYATN